MLVIDLMLPFSSFLGTIRNDYVLNDHGLVEETTGSRLPALEAAIVCKYAVLGAPDKKFEKNDCAVADFACLIRSSHPEYQLDQITQLADEIWQGAAEKIKEFIDCALSEEPFRSESGFSKAVC